MRYDSVKYVDMKHDTREGRHYYTTLYRVAKPRPSVYSSDALHGCHAHNVHYANYKA